MRTFFGNILLLCLILVSACEGPSSSEFFPLANNGILDLRGWDLKRDGPVKLTGEWRFYWKQLVSSPTDTPIGDKTPAEYMWLPNLWTKHERNGKRLPSYGYATLNLKVLIDDPDERLALSIQEIMTAYSLYLNGKKIGSIGQVGTGRESSLPKYLPLVAGFRPDGNELNIHLQISNFHHKKGGASKAILLGKEKDLKDARKISEASDVFLIGSILFMGIYNLALFFYRKRDKSVLYFAIISFLIVLRTGVTSEKFLIYLFPTVGWEFFHKLEYLSFYAAVPFLGMFIYTLFPKEMCKKVIRLLQIACIVFSSLVILTPGRIYSYTVEIYQFMTLAAGIYSIYILFLAWKRKRDGAVLFLIGFFILFLTAINDIFYTNDLIQTGYLIAFGLFAFMCSQALMLSFRSARAFSLIEIQKESLTHTNIAYQKEIEERKILEKNLKETYQNFKDSRIATIMGLAKLAEYRDTDTGLHLERIREYAKLLSIELASLSRYKDYITEVYVDDLYHSSILHDIGKVGIPDSILLKPGRLDNQEFDIMKSHTTIGGDALSEVASKVNVRSFLTLGKEIAYHHHEKWDGSGYPFQLKENRIPLSARIVALADVYDALTSDRPYKKAFSHEKAVAIITEGRGSHFDPNIVDTFLVLESKFNVIRDRLLDEGITDLDSNNSPRSSQARTANVRAGHYRK